MNLNRLAVLVLPFLLAACDPAYLLNDLVRSDGVTRTADIPYDAGPRHTLDVYTPPDATGHALPVVVFLYGGNWQSGNKDIYEFLGRTLGRHGIITVVPDYRLAPKVAFPAFVQDNAAAIAWTLRNVVALGGDPRSVFVMGHSAGAYDAGMIALDRRYLANAGEDRKELAGVITLAGPFNFLPITQPDLKPIFAPVDDGPLSQPITFADGTNPPMLLLAGTDDTTVNPDNTTSLAARITSRGGPVQDRLYPGIGHIGMITAFTPLAHARAPVEDDVIAFIRAHAGGGTPRPQILGTPLMPGAPYAPPLSAVPAPRAGTP